MTKVEVKFSPDDDGGFLSNFREIHKVVIEVNRSSSGDRLLVLPRFCWMIQMTTTLRHFCLSNGVIIVRDFLNDLWKTNQVFIQVNQSSSKETTSRDTIIPSFKRPDKERCVNSQLPLLIIKIGIQSHSHIESECQCGSCKDEQTQWHDNSVGAKWSDFK